MKKVKVYVLSYGRSESGAYIGTNIREMVNELSEAEPGELYTIRVKMMTQDELDNLPDFDGF